jgi:subtilisin family serine protease
MSLSGPPDRLLQELVEAALGRGINVVAAANRGAPRGGFPASVSGVVAVVDEGPGAVPAGMVAAPGVDVPSSLPDSRWAMVSGASYAAAHVSGLLALMLDAQARAGRVRAPVASRLVRQADGRLDACASLACVGAAGACGGAAAVAAEMAVSITQH